MAKINLQSIEILQMDGSYQETDIRKDVCQPLWLDHDKEMVMLGQRLYQGECELTDDEAAIIRKMAESWPWITRDAIERQLCAE